MVDVVTGECGFYHFHDLLPLTSFYLKVYKKWILDVLGALALVDPIQEGSL